MDKWLETRQLQVHFVSAAGLVFKDDKVLLIRSKKRGWEIPGGVVEQGEAILDGLKREIFEESGIIAKPEKLVGIYQRTSMKAGYGPLEGMILPPTVNLTFICRYEGGKESISDESIEVNWFSLQEAKEMITDVYIKKAVEDMLKFDGRQCFGTFKQNDKGIIEFTSHVKYGDLSFPYAKV
ncbi:MAG: NUDIX domain-containing protein [Clostridiales bacterium]|nr:NUDIX domain-containing protein [Clostridiales bacterium]